CSGSQCSSCSSRNLSLYRVEFCTQEPCNQAEPLTATFTFTFTYLYQTLHRILPPRASITHNLRFLYSFPSPPRNKSALSPHRGLPSQPQSCLYHLRSPMGFRSQRRPTRSRRPRRMATRATSPRTTAPRS